MADDNVIAAPGQWDEYFVRAVRDATSVTYQRAAGQAVHEVYLVLAWELQLRGITPEPEAVYDGAILISRRRKPAVLLHN